MPATPDPPVRRIETPTGLTFLFPRLPPGPARRMAVTLLAAGLVLAIAGGAIAGVAAADEPFPTYGLYFAPLGAAGACTAGAAALGMAICTAVHLDGSQLIAVRHLGPVGWPRFMPVNVTSVLVRQDGLDVGFIGGRRTLVWGYPPEWVRPVARELGRRLGVPVTDETRPAYALLFPPFGPY